MEDETSYFAYSNSRKEMQISPFPPFFLSSLDREWSRVWQTKPKWRQVNTPTLNYFSTASPGGPISKHQRQQWWQRKCHSKRKLCRVCRHTLPITFLLLLLFSKRKWIKWLVCFRWVRLDTDDNWIIRRIFTKDEATLFLFQNIFCYLVVLAW